MTQTKDPAATLDIIERFNDVFNRHDVDGVMALMTGDCVFENPLPRPDGERYEGEDSVRGFWERLFAESPSARFESEDTFASGDRCTVRWSYHWVDAGGKHGAVRGGGGVR